MMPRQSAPPDQQAEGDQPRPRCFDDHIFKSPKPLRIRQNFPFNYLQHEYFAMKTNPLIIGHVYFDGNRGARKLLKITPASGSFDSPGVRYEILAATQEYEHLADGTKRPLIGQHSGMSLSGFAAWAKTGCQESEAQPMLDRLKAARIKLSAGETAFMESLMTEFGDLQAESADKQPESLWVSVNSSEARAVAGLAKKGMLIRDFEDGGHESLRAATVINRHGQTANDVKLTAIGVAWLATQFEAAQEADADTQSSETDRPKS